MDSNFNSPIIPAKNTNYIGINYILYMFPCASFGLIKKEFISKYTY